MSRLVEPRVEPQPDGEGIVLCSCGAEMTAEQGEEITPEGRARWMWWRCSLDAQHVTRAIPLPVQMARG